MNASFLEWIQTGSALLGALMTLSAKVGADKNLLVVKRRNLNGNRMIIAMKNVRVERAILITQIALFLCGLGTLYLAPPPYSFADGPRTPNDREMATSIVITRMAMTIGSLTLMFTSYRNWLEERIPILTQTRSESKPAFTVTAQAPPIVVSDDVAKEGDG